MDGIRSHSRPRFLLPSLESHQHYLKRPVLASRLVEITEAATTQITRGVDRDRVYMSKKDADKVHECICMFALAAKLMIADEDSSAVGEALTEDGMTCPAIVEVFDTCITCLKAMRNSVSPEVFRWVFEARGRMPDDKWKQMMRCFQEVEDAVTST